MSESALDAGWSPGARRVAGALAVGAYLFFLLAPESWLRLDGPQRVAAGVTCATALCWFSGALPLGVASLVPGVLFLAHGVLDLETLAGAYAHDLVLLFLGAMVLARGLEHWGVHRRVALAALERFGTSPRRAVLGFMLIAALCSMWISNTATTLMLLPVATAVIPLCEGDDCDTRLGPCLLLGLAYASSLGGIATLIGTGPNLAFRSLVTESFPAAPELGFGEWMRDWAPFSLIAVPAFWWLLTRVLEPVGKESTADLSGIRTRRAALGRWSTGQLRMGACFLVTACLWVSRRDLELGAVTIPGWGRWVPFADDTQVALAMAALTFLLPSGAGGALLRPRVLKRVPWSILLLFGGGISIAAGFSETGLAEVAGRAAAPWLAGAKPWSIVLCTALFTSLLTELTSNTATTFVLLPIAGETAVAAGIHPYVVMLPAAIAASLAFMLPIATPPNAVVFSSGRFSMARMARTGFVLNLAAVVLLTLWFELYVRAVAGISIEVPPWAEP